MQNDPKHDVIDSQQRLRRDEALRWSRATRAMAAFAIAIVLFVGQGSAFAQGTSAASSYNDALADYQAGRYSQAIVQCQMQLGAQPSGKLAGHYRYLLARAYHSKGDEKHARDAYNQYLQYHSRGPMAQQSRLALFGLAYSQKDYAAVIRLHAGLDLSKLTADQRAKTYPVLAESFVAMGRTQQAIDAYEKGIAAGLDADDANARVAELRGVARSEQQSQTVAKPTARVQPVQRVQLQRSRPDADQPAVEVRPGAGRAQPSQPQQKMTGELDEREAINNTLARVQAMLARGESAAAIPLLQKVLPDMPEGAERVDAAVVLAQLQIEQGSYGSAEANLNQAAAGLEALGDNAMAARARKARTQQIALVRIDLANARGNPEAVSRAIDAHSEDIPASKKADAAYIRLHALVENGDYEKSLSTIRQDGPLLQESEHDVAANLLYFRALMQTDRQADAQRLILAAASRHPGDASVLPALLQLANLHTQAGRYAESSELLATIASHPRAHTTLSESTLNQVALTRALVGLHLQKPGQTLNIAQPLTRSDDAKVASEAFSLVAQAYAQLGRYAQASAAFEAQSKVSGVPVSADDQLKHAKVHMMAKRYELAASSFEQWFDTFPDGNANADAATMQAYADALLGSDQHDKAARVLTGIYERDDVNTARKAELAMAIGKAYEQAGRQGDARTWYAQAVDSAEKLPAGLREEFEADVARSRLKAGTGDMGIEYWLTRLEPDTPRNEFEEACEALVEVMERKLPDDALIDKIGDMALAYPTTSSRYFAISSLFVHALVGAGQAERARGVIGRVMQHFAKQRDKLTPDAFGAATAPAILIYYDGLLNQKNGDQVAAIDRFALLLNDFPRSPWREAAAYAAAQSYIELDQPQMARQKLRLIVNKPGDHPRAQVWVEKAREQMKMMTR